MATHVLQDGSVHRCLLCSTATDAAAAAADQVTFDSPARLQAHLVAEHELAGAAGDAACCELCGVGLGGPAGARQHALEHSPAAWRHACPRCPLRFFFGAELRNHQLADRHDDRSASSGVN